MKKLLVPLMLLFCKTAVSHSDSEFIQHKLLPDDGAAEDFFGFDVAIDGDTALVGAFKSDAESGAEDVGSAYVFTRTNKGWVQQAKLVASDGNAGDTFGGKVAFHANWAVVGAIRHDANGQDAGAVYVFKRSGSSWLQLAKLMADDGAAGDAFGQSIAVSDDTLVIGAPHDDDHGKSSGAVYVYRQIDGSWVQQSKLLAPDGAEGDVFGISVALDEDTLLIGADLHDQPVIDAGAAYVYVRDDNHWQLQAKLMADDGGQTDIFGVRVALSGDTALISARRDDDDSMGVDAGSAYVFVRKDSHWHQQSKLTASDGEADDRFGRGVAIWGNQAWISAMHQDDVGSNSGAVYLFAHAKGIWRQEVKLTAVDGVADDLLGWSVATSGDTLIVGANRHDQQGKDSGAAYIIEMKK